MTWTAGKLKTFITSTLRGGFRRYPPKYITLKDACLGKRINPKTGRLGAHYLCNICTQAFPASAVQVDHIFPICPPEVGFTTWDDFITNLFCSKENLQVLCTQCHDAKTKQEREIRNETRRTKKASAL